jgi:hypothetical protein
MISLGKLISENLLMWKEGIILVLVMTKMIKRRTEPHFKITNLQEFRKTIPSKKM